MKAVWKYPITLNELLDERTIQVVSGAKFLHVDIDPAFKSGDRIDQLRLWALVDKDKGTVENRTIRIAGTGHPIQGVVEHIGSVIGGRLAIHVFEVLK